MDILKGNAVVGQSGGPTSAINATLSGVIRGCAEADCVEKLYGMKNGIEGFLKEELIDLSFLFGKEDELGTLENTPASALGSCRLRLPKIADKPEIYERILEIFKKYNIRYFFYIGGNDSMDTVMKLSDFMADNEYEMRVMGVPKTIDNDLVLTDHTPGFGSAAKYIATTMAEICCDCAVYTVPAVTIVEMMGRDAGWLTAAASLPKHLTGSGADLVYLPEVDFSNEEFISSVKKALSDHPNVVVAVSEGIRYENGEYVGSSTQSGAVDAFGHKYLAGAAKVLEGLVRREIGCKVRSLELNLPQRCAAHLCSATDIKESVMAGKYAAECAEKGMSGKMVAFVRRDGEEYKIDLDTVDVSRVAEQVRAVPREFINETGNNVTEKCAKYIAPLILGEVKTEYVNGIPRHISLK